MFAAFNFNMTATLVNNAPIPPAPSVSAVPSPSTSTSTLPPSAKKKNTNFVNLHEPGVVIPPKLNSIYSRLNYEKPKVETQKVVKTIKQSTIVNNTTLDENLILLDNVIMQSNMDSDVFHPGDPSFLLKYDSLKYEVKNPNPSLLFNKPIKTNFDKALNMTISFTNTLMLSVKPEDKEDGKKGGLTLMTNTPNTPHTTHIVNGPVLTVQAPLVYLFLKTESPIYDSGSCRYGFMEDGKCYLVHRLREICLKVKIVSGVAVLDNNL